MSRTNGMTNSPVQGGKQRWYVIVVLGAAIVALVYHLRVETIFACQAGNYDSDRYLAYCNAPTYGEYDHGAFWFGLENTAKESARSAEVLFIGNSRVQLGFSTRTTDNWFSSRSISYYLLGFSESEKYVFEGELLNKIKPIAKVYVVNADRFFETFESESAKFVMHDSKALDRLQEKRRWQQIHRPLCSALPSICGHQYTVFRSRQTGFWTRVGSMFDNHSSTSDDPVVDQKLVNKEIESGRDFLVRLPVQPNCVILTFVPTVNGRRAAANSIAAAVGKDLISPNVQDLHTFDGSHLDYASAERWSAAFLESAGPRIEKCLAEHPSFQR